MQLENYLIPNTDVIDWTLDGEMYKYLIGEGSWHLRGDASNGNFKIVSRIRWGLEPLEFYRYDKDALGHRM